MSEYSLHDEIKFAVEKACNALGFDAKNECWGRDWRADVMVEKDHQRYAFEIQMSPQTLNRTIERQEKYMRDGVIGCWLFETIPAKLSEERPDLPLFQVFQEEGEFKVSLSGRKVLPLEIFVEDFLKGKIQFRSHVLTNKIQHLNIQFYEMPCWDCGVINHLYYIKPEFTSSCNASLHYVESLWGEHRLVYIPKVRQVVEEYAASVPELNLATIKPRYSKTAGKSYVSYGCEACDKIFGDWFVHEAEMEVQYGCGVIETLEVDIEMDEQLHYAIPHWCHPGEDDYCSNGIECEPPINLLQVEKPKTEIAIVVDGEDIVLE